LEKLGAEGYVLGSKAGSSISSPISITGISNVGDQEARFESIKITGVYSSGANLGSPTLIQTLLSYNLVFADILLDSAYFEFFNDYTARHTYIDAFINSDKFTRNKYSSTNVNFYTNHLYLAPNGELKYRFRLKHPMLQDPVLTLSTSSVTGSPSLEVSPDGSNWWEVEKTLISGSLIKYNLTKLAGYSSFYFRFVTGASESFSLNYLKLISWHDYSGQRPIPYIRSNGQTETYSLSFTSGALVYDIRYRDNWSG
jgi:hypothetical protein